MARNFGARTFKDEEIIAITDMFSANHYARHPLVLDSGYDCWLVNNETGSVYLDMLAGYSAVIFGRNGNKYYDRLVSALIKQATELTLISGSYYTESYANFCRKITQLCSMRRVLAMNTGAEAVETAMKIAKRWAYTEKNIPGHAEFISCTNNFHGRTQGVLSLSSNSSHRQGFGPFLLGCRSVPFGNIEALSAAINKNTAAFIVEPIQGEGGINIPPVGYLKEAQEICNNNNVLFILDEVQTGFGRTGTMFAHQAGGVRLDKRSILILGKALSGGILPISAVLAGDEVMGFLNPGSHGSTFGGNPLACAVACEVISILQEDLSFIPNAREVGEYFLGELKKIKSDIIKDVRGRGLLIGVELYEPSDQDLDDYDANYYCEKLLEEGIVSAVTHGNVLRFSPPLIISRKQIDWALLKIKRVLDKAGGKK